MAVSPSILESIQTAIDRHRSFAVFGHEDLDGDCLGSQLALTHWLRGQDKEVLLVSNGPTIENYRFLPGYEWIHRTMPENATAEMTFCVDTSSRDRLADDVRLQGLVVNIDHHPDNGRFGDIDWIEPDAAAVGEMLFELLEAAGGPLTPEIATCLYLAIETDTGGFRYANTSARTLEIAARLAQAGADPHAICDAYYNNQHPDTIRMAGEVMSNLHFEAGGRLAWGEITREMYDRLGGEKRQPEQLAAQIRGIRDVEVALLFHQLDNSTGRVSLRSSGRVAVNRIAEECSGGGHFSAAGCRFEGDYEKGRDRVLAVARRHLDGQGE